MFFIIISENKNYYSKTEEFYAKPLIVAENF